MLILDTDHFSEYLRGSEEGTRLRLRLIGQPSATTIITLEEQARGWLSRIKQARTSAETIFGYGRLHRLFAVSSTWTVLEWDAAADEVFARLRPKWRRVGTMDLRVASMALSQGHKLLSRNLKDFTSIPGLIVEDWLSS